MIHFFEYVSCNEKSKIGVIADKYHDALNLFCAIIQEQEHPVVSFNYIGWEREGISGNTVKHDHFYKMVRRVGDKLMSLDSYSHKDPYWTLEYPLGKEVTPNFGRIFVYNSLLYVKNHVIQLNWYNENIKPIDVPEVYMCKARDPVLISHVPWAGCQPKQYEQFWRLFNSKNGIYESYSEHPTFGKYLNRMSIDNLEHGVFAHSTYAARSVKLIKRIL